MGPVDAVEPVQAPAADQQERQVAQHVHGIGQAVPGAVVCKHRGNCHIGRGQRGAEQSHKRKQRKGEEQPAFAAAESGQEHGGPRWLGGTSRGI
jgi:hypothetical protein